MVLYSFFLGLLTLLGGLFIMKDLTDFIAMGEKVGLTTDKLLSFAESKYESYLKTLEINKTRERERKTS